MILAAATVGVIANAFARLWLHTLQSVVKPDWQFDGGHQPCVVSCLYLSKMYCFHALQTKVLCAWTKNNS